MLGINHFIELFPDYFNLASNVNFLQWLWKDYWILIPLLGGIVFFYIRQRAFLKLALLICFTFGMLLLINVSYYHGHSLQFYLEPQYTLITVFLAFPLVYDVFPAISERKSHIALTAIVVVCLFRIVSVSQEYTQRVDLVRQVITQTEGKVCLLESDLPMDIYKMSWSSPFEVWLLSTWEQKATRQIIILERPEEMSLEHTSNIWITKWLKRNINDLNPRYFINMETDTSYRFVSLKE